jgi:hypothetical protein
MNSAWANCGINIFKSQNTTWCLLKYDRETCQELHLNHCYYQSLYSFYIIKGFLQYYLSFVWVSL